MANSWKLPLTPAGGELRFVFPFFNINSRETCSPPTGAKGN